MDDERAARKEPSIQTDDDRQRQRQNQQLRDDLKYVTDCIQEQRPDIFATTTAGQSSSLLHDVLWQLIDRRLRAEEYDYAEEEENSHPYVPLRVTNEHDGDEQDEETTSRLLLQLLRDEVRVVESYNDGSSDDDDDKLVCLVDYNATAAPPSVVAPAPADDDTAS